MYLVAAVLLKRTVLGCFRWVDPPVPSGVSRVIPDQPLAWHHFQPTQVSWLNNFFFFFHQNMLKPTNSRRTILSLPQIRIRNTSRVNFRVCPSLFLKHSQKSENVCICSIALFSRYQPHSCHQKERYLQVIHPTTHSRRWNSIRCWSVPNQQSLAGLDLTWLTFVCWQAFMHHLKMTNSGTSSWTKYPWEKH